MEVGCRVGIRERMDGCRVVLVDVECFLVDNMGNGLLVCFFLVFFNRFFVS